MTRNYRQVTVEGPGDSGDRLPFPDEFLVQVLLAGPLFLWSAEGDAAYLGGQHTIVCPAKMRMRSNSAMPAKIVMTI